MKFVALILALALTGCATKPAVVKVPVSEPCTVKVPARPPLAYEPGKYSQVFPMVRDLLGDRELMLGYETELEAAIKACTTK